jgi:outer membrane protein assembly factor BamB
VSSAAGCAAFGGAAVSGSTVFLPCTTGVRRADIGSNGSITLSWQASGIPGAPVVYGNAVLATSQATGRLYILDPTTGAVRTSLAVGSLTRFATPALDVGRAYVGTTSGIVAVNIG